jgi:hypothetical protein
MTAPVKRRIIPRADHFLRYINDIILHNLRSEEEEADTIISIPAIVSRAYMVVNETATLEVSDLTSDHEIVTRQ